MICLQLLTCLPQPTVHRWRRILMRRVPSPCRLKAIGLALYARPAWLSQPSVRAAALPRPGLRLASRRGARDGGHGAPPPALGRVAAGLPGLPPDGHALRPAQPGFSGPTVLAARDTDRTYRESGIWCRRTTAYRWSITQIVSSSRQVVQLGTIERSFNLPGLVAGLLFVSPLVSSLSARGDADKNQQEG